MVGTDVLPIPEVTATTLTERPLVKGFLPIKVHPKEFQHSLYATKTGTRTDNVVSIDVHISPKFTVPRFLLIASNGNQRRK
jgi:hypothetical protein